MMRTLLLITVFLNLGCKSVSLGSNSSAEQIPAGMNCPASVDPTQGCPSPTTSISGSDQRPDRPALAVEKKDVRSIFGRCEMTIDGERKARPCAGLTLVLLGPNEADRRTASVDGYNFSFSNLNQESYRFMASSDQYDVFSETKELSPGQAVKVRVRVKPRD